MTRILEAGLGILAGMGLAAGLGWFAYLVVVVVRITWRVWHD